ncbi:MFS transporter [Pseudolysinimonas sp.]|uniref:MFS transporter n=1 Tax=Pseudolysinimonas sp. TaxID=2680009 RepID=UPI003F7EC22A
MTSIEPSYSRAGLAVRWMVLAFALFLIGTNSFIIAGVLPQIARDLRVPATDVGYTITVYSILVAVLAPAVAVLLPRLSRTVLMTAGLAAFAVGVVVAALAPDFAVFTAGRVIASLGGAAVVPTATAAGASITPPARRGQAIAVVGIGFTAASAVGAPLGTAIASVSTWRVPMLGVAALTLVIGAALALVVRRVPLGEPITLTRRFAILRDGRILLPLATTLLVAAGFNLVFIFSSAVTGQTGVVLAVLLLIYGVFGIVGNTVSGPLTDRFGSRRVGTAFMALEIVALAAIAVVGHSVVGLAVAFVVWGVSAFASVIPIQHRLLAVDPRTASVAISWFSTALYVGIAVAPIVGAVALSTGESALIPVGGAILTVLGLAAFLTGYIVRRGHAVTAAQETLAVDAAERV